MKIPLPKNFTPQSPTIIKDIQESAIALISPQIYPQLINDQILKTKEIIPHHWQIEKISQLKGNIQQITYQQGLRILVQFGKIIFSINLKKNPPNLTIIINKFAKTFDKLQISQIHISIRRLISFPGNIENANEFIKKEFLNKKKWQTGKNQPTKTEIVFFYNFKPTPLTIAISDVKIRLQNNKTQSALLFKGIYTYPLNYRFEVDKLNKINTIINSTSENINVFNKIINQVFLS